MERKALPIAGVCPKKNIMTSETAESYKTTFAVTSSEYGYANVRSTADFSGEESTESILVMLSDGQKFCSSGSVLARDADGAQMGIAYYVLLEDSKKQLCRGLVWEGLVKE